MTPEAKKNCGPERGGRLDYTPLTLPLTWHLTGAPETELPGTSHNCCIVLLLGGAQSMFAKSMQSHQKAQKQLTREVSPDGQLGTISECTTVKAALGLDT